MTDITALQLVTAALKKCGAIAAGVTVQQTDLDDALFDLNAMLRQWQRRRWLVYRLADLCCVSTGAAAYSVGPGGDISVDQRPDQIEGAYARLLRGGPASVQGDFIGADSQSGFTAANLGYGAGVSPFDYPMQIIASREDYAEIGMKGLGSWPAAAFYDPDIPLGGLYPWPIPVAGNWELHILVKQSLEVVTDLSLPLGLPAEYQEALLYNLVVRLRPSYGLDPDPVVSMLATAGLNTIRAANSAIKRLIPNVPLGRRGGGIYWPGLEAIGGGGGSIGSFGIGVSSIGNGSSGVTTTSGGTGTTGTGTTTGTTTVTAAEADWGNFDWDDGTLWS